MLPCMDRYDPPHSKYWGPDIGGALFSARLHNGPVLCEDIGLLCEDIDLLCEDIGLP